MRAALDAGLPITSMAVWDKQWIGPGGSQGLRPSYEMFALMAQPDFAVKDRGIPDVWQSQGRQLQGVRPPGREARAARAAHPLDVRA
jgi:hypothetical protein